MQAMIFAAGLGTRLKPLTENIPKALVKVKGKTLLEHTIEKLKGIGVSRIIINTHHFSNQIIDFLDTNNFGIKILVSDETNLLRDTGGGLKHASHLFENEPFIIYNVDIFSDIDLLDAYKNHLSTDSLATIIVRNRETKRYFLFDDQMRLCGWENIQSGEQRIVIQKDHLRQYSFSGIHIVDPKIFELMPDKKVFSIIDLYLNLAKNHIIRAHIDTSDKWIDVGKIDQLNELNNIID